MSRMLSLRYFHKLIKRVNERDNEHEIHTINTFTGLVKVLILSNNCPIKIDPRLAYIVFQNISAMYIGPKHQETLQASLATQNYIIRQNWTSHETCKKCRQT